MAIERSVIAAFLGTMLGTIFGVMLLGIAALQGFGTAWGAFVEFGVSNDLQEWRAALDDVTVDPSDAASLRQHISQIRTDVQTGALEPSFLSWVAHENVFEDAFADGTLTALEARNIHDELDLFANLERT